MGNKLTMTQQYTECWYNELIRQSAELLLGSKLIGDLNSYKRYSELYDYLIKRRKKMLCK